MAEIRALPVPVIAAIHGACLGAALKWRWPAIDVSVPTTLKRSRTAGGTVRAFTGIGRNAATSTAGGVSTALDMILTGKQLRARQALKAGLVDDVVPQTILLEAAVELAKKNARRSGHYRSVNVSAGPLGRALLSHGA